MEFFNNLWLLQVRRSEPGNYVLPLLSKDTSTLRARSNPQTLLVRQEYHGRGEESREREESRGSTLRQGKQGEQEDCFSRSLILLRNAWLEAVSLQHELKAELHRKVFPCLFPCPRSLPLLSILVPLGESQKFGCLKIKNCS